jgi:hypothetical protein
LVTSCVETAFWNTWLKKSYKGRIEMTVRRGRRRKQQLDDLKEKKIYWVLKEETLGRTVWRTRFGRGCGPVLRQDCRMNEWWSIVA